MFVRIAANKDDYGKFCEQFGKCLNIGFQEGTANRETMAELLTFKTSQSGNEQISLKEYVGLTKTNQTDNFCITFESLAVVSTTPVMELVNKKRFDVLYMVDLLEENAV